MKGKEVLIGFVVVAAVIGAIFFLRARKVTKAPAPISSPSIEVVEEKIEEGFKITIPSDVERIELAAVSEITGTGLATRKYAAGKFTHMVLADLPDPTVGSFYQGWLVKDDTSLATDRLQIAKGGYLLEFIYPTDLSSYNKVVVSLEKVLGQRPTKSVLEGSF